MKQSGHLNPSEETGTGCSVKHGGMGRQQQQHCDEIQLLKHSPFYSESQFTNLLNTNNGLYILDINIENAFTNWKLLLIGLIRVTQLVLYI